MIDFLGVRKLCFLAFPVSGFQFPVMVPQTKNGELETGNPKAAASLLAASCRTPNKALTFAEAATKIDPVVFPLLMVHQEFGMEGVRELPILRRGNISVP